MEQGNQHPGGEIVGSASAGAAGSTMAPLHGYMHRSRQLRFD
jgi:hypothetical protein